MYINSASMDRFYHRRKIIVTTFSTSKIVWLCLLFRDYVWKENNVIQINRKLPDEFIFEADVLLTPEVHETIFLPDHLLYLFLFRCRTIRTYVDFINPPVRDILRWFIRVNFRSASKERSLSTVLCHLAEYDSNLENMLSNTWNTNTPSTFAMTVSPEPLELSRS